MRKGVQRGRLSPIRVCAATGLAQSPGRNLRIDARPVLLPPVAAERGSAKIIASRPCARFSRASLALAFPAQLAQTAVQVSRSKDNLFREDGKWFVFFAVGGTRLIPRLIPRLPLDVAADAGLLLDGHGPAFQHGVQRGPQIFAGDRQAVAGAAVIELAAIDQFFRAIKYKEVGVQAAR